MSVYLKPLRNNAALLPATERDAIFSPHLQAIVACHKELLAGMLAIYDKNLPDFSKIASDLAVLLNRMAQFLKVLRHHPALTRPHRPK